MVLVYAHNTSARLSYICSFIFKELMGVDIAITTHITSFKNHTGIKINYSSRRIVDDEIFIRSTNLLFEKDIREQQIECFEIKSYKAFFQISESDWSFDIFAAAFYLLSRYEEYLPHSKDEYGRYGHKNSIAFKEDFLHLPLINIWVKDFADAIQKKYPIFNIQYSTFKFVPTYDIDIAYSYKHKGFSRNIGGFLRSPSFTRLLVLLRLRKDPFDTFDKLDALHQQYNLQPIYFFLLAQKNGVYDKNILPHTKAMQKLVKNIASKYIAGIHPSWQSGDDISLLKEEVGKFNALIQTTDNVSTRSRQHYIRFNLPEGYTRLIDVGITDDHSMGYGSINGFRASTATPFYWFDLSTNKRTDLRIHPFCYMEANSFYEQKLTPVQALEELKHYYSICKNVNGTFITVFHNHMIGRDKLFTGWGEMYEQFLQQMKE
ncbi:polysaccharide deacetylase family protein [Ferruginibacter lapsinanis]|uniref:polysaccharide deacetylase family protein n=1 Tax=Ferruginibacter lapsinanis TaxID=563172 RepID=UPI001E3174CC|nr:polysaccharide deacetylase family protein [Ferruginibacter lapsinanis]UEG50997.1 polysaccharide deacetylase family protein [Ferruginibacter lapsinanis]